MDTKQEQATNKSVLISTRHTKSGWLAWLDDNPAIFATGETQVKAIDALIEVLQKDAEKEIE